MRSREERRVLAAWIRRAVMLLLGVGIAFAILWFAALRQGPDDALLEALESRDMPTQYGSTKPRPHFEIRGWKTHDDTPRNLLTSETPLVEVEAPSLAEELNDEIPDLGSEASVPKKKKK